jgi:signal transduction histidine kinase
VSKSRKQEDFREIIEQKLEEFKELISLKGITLATSFNSDIKLNMSPIVAEILINNFISNGIKHNTKKGILSIETTENYITF